MMHTYSTMVLSRTYFQFIPSFLLLPSFYCRTLHIFCLYSWLVTPLSFSDHNKIIWTENNKYPYRLKFSVFVFLPTCVKQFTFAFGNFELVFKTSVLKLIIFLWPFGMCEIRGDIIAGKTRTVASIADRGKRSTDSTDVYVYTLANIFLNTQTYWLVSDRTFTAVILHCWLNIASLNSLVSLLTFSRPTVGLLELMTSYSPV